MYRLPVRSAVLKPHAGELVVGWVTTSESSLLYVFVFLINYHAVQEPQATDVSGDCPGSTGDQCVDLQTQPPIPRSVVLSANEGLPNQ
ncbi:hypothetical protein N7505_003844 [Penicillium chrysogenum]|uniref:Uncharacterized protein n=1 Tax=Penicillium chrysogenum TaxID=5076 RepID=A0ABQ8WSJ4_PENCH|nr:hypothetical protein N7505_003844 [Penicillium chrysogenum]